ncbi:MAG TPA: DUF4159 domain-containing protein [Gemmatimonadaceae bacterium]|nr:DUF4159 domain-containing protein [Gemmatimonadaceae bacterium]
MRGRVMRYLLPLGIAILAVSVAAQGRRFGRDPIAVENNVPYDGRFTFVRIRYTPLNDLEGFGRGDRKWDHDYPRAERNFMKILSEITLLQPYLEGGNVFAADDPELMKFPIAYLCEPGFWTMTESEKLALRAYIEKGGFLIIDDFIGQHWYNFEAQVRELLPQARLIRLDESDAIFDSFYRIESLAFTHPNFRADSEFWGVFEDNDRSKRLQMIVNYNNDIGDYWEWSDAGFLPIDLTNEAYKLGVNYIMYAFTH